MARSSNRHPFACVLVGLAALLLPALANAQTADCNSAEHQRGRQLRVQRQDQQAYELFRSLFERERSGCAQARMGSALHALGRWVEAEEALAGALAMSNDAWVTASRAVLEQELTEIRAHIGEVELVVENGPSGAGVFIDGRQVGTLPLSRPLRVAAGSVVLEVRADGYRTVQRALTVEASGRARESFAMVRALQNEQGGSVASGNGGSESSGVSATGAPPTTNAGRRNIVPGVIALSGAGVLGITGGVLWGLGEASYARYAAQGPGPCRTVDGAPEELCASDRASASTFRRVGVILVGAGAVSLAAGVVLMIAGPRSAERSQQARVQWTCVPSTSVLGAECIGAF